MRKVLRRYECPSTTRSALRSRPDEDAAGSPVRWQAVADSAVPSAAAGRRARPGAWCARVMPALEVRAKRKIKAAGIPFRIPPDHLLRERLDAVLTIVYLIFNEGYGGRDELAAEAIWLGRALTELLPDDPEVRGLLAMMLLHDSRRETRFNDGELVLLEDQDPARWNTTQIAQGRAELDQAIALGGRGPYVLQAAIASLHAEMPCDWAQIAALYGELTRLTASPVVELHRAIAVGETEGPQAGLRIVDRLGPRRLPLPALNQGRTAATARAHR